jgi:hypothetical protein
MKNYKIINHFFSSYLMNVYNSEEENWSLINCWEEVNSPLPNLFVRMLRESEKRENGGVYHISQSRNIFGKEVNIFFEKCSRCTYLVYLFFIK